MSETPNTTKRAVATVSCVWFPDHAKDAKSFFEQTFGFMRKLLPLFHVTVEAAGSGKVLSKLQVLLGASVSELKERLYDELRDANKCWSSWRDICLFQGQGGPELVDNFAGDTTLVLVTRLVKTGVFFEHEHETIRPCRVYVTSECLVTADPYCTRVWDLWTSNHILSHVHMAQAVSDEYIVTETPNLLGMQLNVLGLQDGVPKCTVVISETCSFVFLCRASTRMVVQTGFNLRLFDLNKRCWMWETMCTYSHISDICFSYDDGFVTFFTGVGRCYVSKDGSSGNASEKTSVCEEPQPIFSASIYNKTNVRLCLHSERFRFQ